MRIYEHFPYTGDEQRWKVPAGVTEVLFECWGASGGMPSQLVWHGKKRQVKGGTGPRNSYFYNNPYHEGQLGHSFSNNAGYAAGIKNVSEGETFYIFVGGNGHPGHSTIKLHSNGTSYSIGLRGGSGGWNGGGSGGKGAHIFQNLYNSTSHHVHYRRATAPNSAKNGQKWYDTNAHIVYQCNANYSDGNSAGKWDKVTHSHGHAVGPSGGGGGGATDIRFNGDDLGDRILVAGGAGGAGGHYFHTGPAAATLRRIPAQPSPPFGSDDKASGATGVDHTWATSINYLVGGWGRGGMGGASGPLPGGSSTTDGGTASSGGSGGPATARHQDGTAPKAQHGSAGHGGTNDAGGKRGSGGSGAQNGSSGQGGNGADASGGYDDWCAGGGGGGGGYYGGGGGGQGFKVAGRHGEAHTHGGGGGGGSNYAAPVFTASLLAGCARPPFGEGHHGTGANGHGGFARLTYHKPPKAKWASIPRAALHDSTFTATFDYRPAQTDGAKIAYFTVGTSTTASDTAPTTTTTVMVTDDSLTEFSHDFVAPGVGATWAYFVKVTDEDGDTSDWLKQTVVGLADTSLDTATITAPAAGSQFIDSATVTWTVGTQTPLAAYRLGLTGTDLVTGDDVTIQTSWRRGGSRVNLALDPGFEGSAVWASDNNTALVPDATHPGVSGSDGKITWAFTDDNSAEQHTTTWDNLTPGTTYRLHLDVASATGLDLRPVSVQVWDDDGLLTSADVDLSAASAGTYVTLDLPFTPHTQGVYVVLLPAATGYDRDNPLLSIDFEDGTLGGFSTGTSDGTQSNSGDLALKVTAASSLDPSASLTGAGDYVVETWVYTPSGGAGTQTLGVSGTGVAALSASGTDLDTWVHMRLPFTWDGTGTVSIDLNGDATGVWYDDVAVYTADTESPDFGNTDSGQEHFLANMLVEVVYEEDGAGYGTYFDGTNLNGNTGAVSWSGTVNASPSILTGTDVVTGDLTATDQKLNDGSLFLDTLTCNALIDGFDGNRASESVLVNPSIPATPTVSMEVNSSTGLITLSLDANDGAASTSTVYFDIFRNGTRIATGLVPDDTTRLATFTDTPGHAEAASYRVRAFDSEGGYADQTDGTVTLVP